MNTKILNGKIISDKIASKLEKEISKLKTSPTLAIVQVGENPQSGAYIAMKKKFAERIGAKVHHIILENSIEEKKLLELINELNSRRDINGIIVQLPIPKKLDRYKVMEAISPLKDVDGLNSKNSALIYERAFGGTDPRNVPEGLIPATAKGVIRLLKEYKIPLEGRKVLVIGRSLLVGKPIAMLLIKENATITVAHSKTKNLSNICKENDIIISAVGKVGVVKKESFRKGQVIIDVGTNAIKGPKTLEEVSKTKLVGDVDYQSAIGVVSAISPVPGGIGPMTVASLFENLLEAYKKQG